jgi:hypothetical protein
MPPLVIAGNAPLLRGTVDPSSWDVQGLDLTEVTWVTPFDVAALAAVWLRLKAQEESPSVVLPRDPTVRAYLVGMGLHSFLPGDWGDGGGCAVEPPWLRLTRIESADAWDDLQSELWPVARATLGDYDLTQRTLDILGELVDNAATHGRSPVGTFVCAQTYTGTTSGLPPGVWLGIADGGVGIPAHLRRNPKYRTIARDEELIGMARKEWVTGTTDRRGWGLVEVFENATAAGPSQVVIQSGRGQGDFRLRPDARSSTRFTSLDSPVPGTWIHVRVMGR